MRYWHIENDKLDELRGFQTDGPIWTTAAYYGRNQNSKTWGVFDPRKVHLYFPTSDKRKRAPDMSIVGVPCCSKRIFSLFSQLLEGHIKTFDLSVGDEEWVSFRPILLIDGEAIDMDKSKYRRFSTGEPYGFRHIVLRVIPGGEPPIFSFSDPDTALGRVIVSDDFKRIVEENDLQGVKFLPASPV